MNQKTVLAVVVGAFGIASACNAQQTMAPYEHTGKCAAVAHASPDLEWTAPGLDSDRDPLRTTFSELHEVVGRRVALTGVFHIEFARDGSTPHPLWFRLLNPNRVDGSSVVFLSLGALTPGVVYFLEHEASFGDRCAFVDGVYRETDTASPSVMFPQLLPVYRLMVWRSAKVSTKLTNKWTLLPEPAVR